MMDIYSHCYKHLISTQCTTCNFIAKYDKTNLEVQINVSFCGPNTLSAYAYKDGIILWSKQDIEVNCQPADCPFTQAQTPICVPSYPRASLNC